MDGRLLYQRETKYPSPAYLQLHHLLHHMLVIKLKVYKIYALRKTADINAILHIIAFIAINNIAALFV